MQKTHKSEKALDRPPIAVKEEPDLQRGWDDTSCKLADRLMSDTAVIAADILGFCSRFSSYVQRRAHHVAQQPRWRWR